MNIEPLNMLDFNAFKNPSKENSVIYGWIWNSPLTKESIKKQIAEFSKAGITGLYVLPLPYDFRPERIRTFLHPQYLSEDYFNLLRFAYTEAKNQGIQLWIYDEGGWPSGGACGNTARENPAAVETVLSKNNVTLNVGETYSLKQDVWAFIGKEKVIDSFTAKQEVIVSEYFLVKKTDNNPNRVDSTNESVTNTFINNTYEKYYQHLGDMFGSDISLIFTDEPAVIGGIIPEDFFNKFKAKFGYDLKDYLPVLLNPDLATTNEETLARIHYGKLVGEMFCNNFCNKLANWCKDHNIKFGGHLDLDHKPEGGAFNPNYAHIYYSHLHALSCFDVPGIDVIWNQIRMPSCEEELPTTDNAYPFYPRIAPSAAHQTGKNLALSESFGVYGDGLSFDDMRYVLNYQAIRGINAFNVFMVTSSDERNCALVERPIFTPAKPGFYNHAHFNKYFSRLSYLLRLGTPVCDTALYHPSADFFANNEIRNRAAESYTKLGCAMEDENIYFDIIDEYAIENAEVTKDGLKLGNMTYKHIVLPECKFIENHIKEKIAPFISKGEPLVATQNKKLRIMARKTENGTLWFVFNEGHNTANETLNIPANNLYRLDALLGTITKATKAEINIPSGEIAVFFVTDTTLVCDKCDAEYSIEINGFKKVSAKRTVIDNFGIKMVSVDANEIPETDFSGEITYSANFKLPNKVKKKDLYRIVLEDTQTSATAFINGKQVATFGLTPMKAQISGKDISKEGTIDITICNTSADEILSKKEFISKTFPKAEIGPYAEKAYTFEERKPPLKFGKVYIEKIQLV